MLKLVSNDADHRLALQIDSGEKNIFNLNSFELIQLGRMAGTYPQEQDRLLELTKKALSPIVTEYNSDGYEPYWFRKNTKFQDHLWHYQFGKTKGMINFDVQLNDGKKLTAEKHRPLLNSFKFWLTTLGNPSYYSQKLLKPSYVKSQLNQVLAFIDAFLINSEVLNLAVNHLSVIDNKFVVSLLSRIASVGSIDGIYDYRSRLRSYLLSNINNISDETLNLFLDSFPYVSIDYSEEMCELQFTNSQRKKACCYLYHAGAYIKKGGNIIPIPTSKYLRKLFDNTLSIQIRTFKPINSLRIIKYTHKNEMLSIPVRCLDSTTYTDSFLGKNLTIFKTIQVINSHDWLCRIPENAFANVSVKRIKQHVQLRGTGRVTTLPAPVVIKAVRE